MPSSLPFMLGWVTHCSIAVKVVIAERLLGCLAAEDTVPKLTPANTPINRAESKLNENWIWILNISEQWRVLDYKLRTDESVLENCRLFSSSSHPVENKGYKLFPSHLLTCECHGLIPGQAMLSLTASLAEVSILIWVAQHPLLLRGAEPWNSLGCLFSCLWWAFIHWRAR